MKVKGESEVAQSCPTLSDPMDCSPPSSSIHGIFQARVLEWGAIAFSKQGATPTKSQIEKAKITAIFIQYLEKSRETVEKLLLIKKYHKVIGNRQTHTQM